MFPYLPVGINADSMEIYRISISKSGVKYKMLFFISEKYYNYFPQKKISKHGIFNHEINTFKLKSSNFISQRYLSHLFTVGSKNDVEIINNKACFHEFCVKHKLSTPDLLGNILNGNVELIVNTFPWKSGQDFFVKPIFGSQSKGILEFRLKDIDTYEILDQNRTIKAEFIPDFLKYHQKKGRYIIQEKVKIAQKYLEIGHSNVPIIRVLSLISNDQVEILNPVLIINKEKQYLNSRLSNKDFFGLDAANGSIIGEIIFDHSPQQLEHFVMPDWKVLIDMITIGHTSLATIGIIGWDVAISDDGYTLIEANKSPWLEIHQKAPFDSLSFLKKVMNLP